MMVEVERERKGNESKKNYNGYTSCKDHITNVNKHCYVQKMCAERTLLHL